MNRKAFAARVWSKLVLFERRHGLLPRGGRVLAAVSGGPDSVCLAHFLSQMSRRKGFALEILHIHHGLRGRAADGDARFVLALGRRLGAPAAVARAGVRALARRRGRGLEEAARTARYEALSRRARAGRFGIVAAGHQLDDQAETLLLHLLRGTRPEGLGGMPERRPLAPGVELIRPLLPLTRAEVLEYLRAHGLDWREDATNADPRMERNWVRAELLPLLENRRPGIRRRLAALAEGTRALLAKGPGSAARS